MADTMTNMMQLVSQRTAERDAAQAALSAEQAAHAATQATLTQRTNQLATRTAQRDALAADKAALQANKAALIVDRDDWRDRALAWKALADLPARTQDDAGIPDIMRVMKRLRHVMNERDAALVERDTALPQRDDAVRERDAAVTARAAAEAARDAVLVQPGRAQLVAERDEALAEAHRYRTLYFATVVNP